MLFFIYLVLLFLSFFLGFGVEADLGRGVLVASWHVGCRRAAEYCLFFPLLLFFLQLQAAWRLRDGSFAAVQNLFDTGRGRRPDKREKKKKERKCALQNNNPIAAASV